MIKVLKRNLTRYIILLLLVVLFLNPMYAIIVTGFKSFEDFSLSTMWSLPKNWDMENYIYSFNRLLPYAKNSFILTIFATILSTILGSINGYALTKWKFRGSNYLFIAILLGMFIPHQSILIPLVLFLDSIGLYSSVWGLILAHTVYGIPITTLIFKNYYERIPDELLEAAKIDGAGIFGIYFKVLFPISIPAFAVVIIWQFTNIWNDFLLGLIVTPNPQSQPITVALKNMTGSSVIDWNILMSAALITTLPTLLLYLLVGKYFIKGLMAGSLKG